MATVRNHQAIDYNTVVADNIRAELARARWSGRKAAAALGLSTNWVQRRLSGETPLDPNDIALFADFLNVSIDTLFTTRDKDAIASPNNDHLILWPEIQENNVVSLHDYRAQLALA